jgi:hypothetical protein
MATNEYMGFNLSPLPTGGQGAYGKVPGQIGAPPSIYDQLSNVYPNIQGLTSGAGAAIGNQLAGQLSPETQSNIGNYAAARGLSMGQPNSPLANMIGMNITGTTSEALQQQGIGNYQNFLTGLGSTQSNPAMLAEIAQYNAMLGAAPDPEAAANQQLSLLDRYMAGFGAGGSPASGGRGSISFSGKTTGLGYDSPLGFGGMGTGSYGYSPLSSPSNSPAFTTFDTGGSYYNPYSDVQLYGGQGGTPADYGWNQMNPNYKSENYVQAPGFSGMNNFNLNDFSAFGPGYGNLDSISAFSGEYGLGY